MSQNRLVPRGLTLLTLAWRTPSSCSARPGRRSAAPCARSRGRRPDPGQAVDDPRRDPVPAGHDHVARANALRLRCSGSRRRSWPGLSWPFRGLDVDDRAVQPDAHGVRRLVERVVVGLRLEDRRAAFGRAPPTSGCATGISLLTTSLSSEMFPSGHARVGPLPDIASICGVRPIPANTMSVVSGRPSASGNPGRPSTQQSAAGDGLAARRRAGCRTRASTRRGRPGRGSPSSTGGTACRSSG